MTTLFESQQPQGTTCRTCAFRFRAQTDDHSTKWEQYCEKLPPKRRNTVGRLKIKVTNPACGYYRERKKTEKNDKRRNSKGNR